jgi:hypothetical protein
MGWEANSAKVHLYAIVEKKPLWGGTTRLFLAAPSRIDDLRVDFTEDELRSATSKRRQKRTPSASNLLLVSN